VIHSVGGVVTFTQLLIVYWIEVVKLVVKVESRALE
jgi:hypothetical protein